MKALNESPVIETVNQSSKKETLAVESFFDMVDNTGVEIFDSLPLKQRQNLFKIVEGLLNAQNSYDPQKSGFKSQAIKSLFGPNAMVSMYPNKVKDWFKAISIITKKIQKKSRDIAKESARQAKEDLKTLAEVRKQILIEDSAINGIKDPEQEVIESFENDNLQSK